MNPSTEAAPLSPSAREAAPEIIAWYLAKAARMTRKSDRNSLGFAAELLRMEIDSEEQADDE